MKLSAESETEQIQVDYAQCPAAFDDTLEILTADCKLQEQFQEPVQAVNY